MTNRAAKIICATLAGVALITMIGFLAGKLDPSQTMLFMVSVPPRAPQAPVLSAKEILTGTPPVSDRLGKPVLNAESNKQIRDSLAQYDVCDTYCCRRDML